MIDGVRITPLRQILDERGKIMHMLKSTDPHFSEFGEIYFSTAYPGVVKAWHYHKEMVLNYAVPNGRIKFVLYDDREESPTQGMVQEIFLGNDNYCLVTVPAKVWNGFKCIGTETAIIANCSSIPHDPDEMQRKDPTDPDIPYQWPIVSR